MQLKMLDGYPDLVGRRSIFCGYGNGPKPYVTGGDPLTTGQFNYYIDSVDSSDLTVSGTYYCLPIQSKVGPRPTWKLKWIVAATNVEAANGLDLSAEQIQVSGKGGIF